MSIWKKYHPSSDKWNRWGKARWRVSHKWSKQAACTDICSWLLRKYPWPILDILLGHLFHKDISPPRFNPKLNCIFSWMHDDHLGGERLQGIKMPCWHAKHIWGRRRPLFQSQALLSFSFLRPYGKKGCSRHCQSPKLARRLRQSHWPLMSCRPPWRHHKWSTFNLREKIFSHTDITWAKAWGVIDRWSNRALHSS